MAFTILLDFIFLVVGWYLFYSAYSVEREVYTLFWGISPFASGLVLAGYWILILALFGLYKKMYLISRFDEFVRVVKAVVFGTLILFFVVTIFQESVLVDATTSTLFYLVIIISAIGLDRFLIRSIQRSAAQRGRGLHRAIIIGVGEYAKDAYEELERNKTLGMEVLGFVETNGHAQHGTSAVEHSAIVGHVDQLDRLIRQLEVQDVIVAMEQDNSKDLIKILSKVDVRDVTVKILPDFYQLVSGLNKTNQIFGLPLIEISPDTMPTWEKITKRLIDITVSLAFLIVMLPVCLLLAIWIKIDSKGPVIYKQKRVGYYGRNFTMLKFRTMFRDAEAQSGPVWAQENDPRITRAGYWLRKLRLDEIPQFLNVLAGDMSLVGPRPERPHFVEQFKQKIPLYTRRLRVKPGITGWAQVKWKYDASLQDVKEKTKYDLFYVENMSLRMDMKILINTIMTVIRAKGQ